MSSSNDNPLLKLYYCPFTNCQQFLAVLDSNEIDACKSITCPKCGQAPEQTELLPVEAGRWSVAELASLTCLQANVFKGQAGKRLPIHCMTDGISPFLCNLLSHLFTYYDVSPKTQDMQRMTEIDDCTEIFDVSTRLCRSAFQIYNTKLAKMSGYGRNLKAYEYLSPTIDYIAHSTASNKDLFEVLDVHGHGSRLYQALSKAMTGCEIYWHALQENLVKHFENLRYIYTDKFPALQNDENWIKVLWQCDLENMQSDTEYGMKLHIQGMSNLLKRPIILLDRLKYIKVKQSTVILFLPLINPTLCRHEVTLKMNSPLVIGWSNDEYKSFVPVVSYGIELSFSNSILNVWSGDEDLKSKYIEFDLKNLQCKVANGVSPSGLPQKIMLMEGVFKFLHGVDPKLICNYCEDVWYQSSFPNNSIRAILKDCIWRANHVQLWRCLLCRRLSLIPPTGKKLLTEGGLIYDYIVAQEKELRPGVLYSLPPLGKFAYCSKTEGLVPIFTPPRKCDWCKFSGDNMRIQMVERVLYMDGDHTEQVHRFPHSRCPYKRYHWFNNREYINMPLQLRVGVKVGEVQLWRTLIFPIDESDMDWKKFVVCESKSFAKLFEKSAVTTTTSEAILQACTQRIEDAKSFAQSLACFACKNSLDSCLFPFFMPTRDIYEETFVCLSRLSKNNINYTNGRIVGDLKRSFNDYYALFLESPLGSDVRTLALKEEVVVELPHFVTSEEASKTVMIYAVPSDVTFPRELPISSGSITYKYLMDGLKGADVLNRLRAVVDSDGIFHMAKDDQDAAILAANSIRPIVLLLDAERRTSKVMAMTEIRKNVSSYLVDCIIDLAEKHFQKPIHLWPYMFNVAALFSEKGLLTSFVDSIIRRTKSNVHVLLPALTANQVYSRCEDRGLMMCVEQIAHIKIDESCRAAAKKAVERAAITSSRPWQNLKIGQSLVTTMSANPSIRIIVIDEPVCPLESFDNVLP